MSEDITLDEERKATVSSTQYGQTYSSSAYQYNYLPQRKKRMRKESAISETEVTEKDEVDSEEEEASAPSS